MSLASEMLATCFIPGRLTLRLMLDMDEVGMRAEPAWKVRDGKVSMSHRFVFEKYTRFNAVGFFDGDRLVERDLQGVEPRALVPGDEWTYHFDSDAKTVWSK